MVAPFERHGGDGGAMDNGEDWKGGVVAGEDGGGKAPALGHGSVGCSGKEANAHLVFMGLVGLSTCATYFYWISTNAI